MNNYSQITKGLNYSIFEIFYHLTKSLDKLEIIDKVMNVLQQSEFSEEFHIVSFKL